MANQSRLTLAVIVKDEAELLKGLLHHHRELYDEAVVVDTGSSDHSRKVALEAGARVLDHAWNDDFAAARNLGLNQVDTPWVLQLDCDERINPAHFPELRALVQKPADSCYELPINNYTANSKGGEWCQVQPGDGPWCSGAPGYMRTYPVRLFPNLPDLRFSGVIHENLTDGIGKTGLEIRRGTQIIHHTGLLDAEGLLRRDKLYTRLLKKKVSQTPNDLNGLTEYAKLLVSKGHLEIAEKMMKQGLDGEKTMGQNALANLLMVEIQARLGKMDLALERLTPTIHQHPNQLLCWIQASALYLVDGQVEKAQLYLQQGRKLFPSSAVLKELEAKV
jgi:glycosyltransferase involved in cell wall biosynthesis